MRDLNVVILAAGKGTRMNSAKPKVLHELAGRPLLGHVLATTERLEPTTTAVVVGYAAEQVRDAFSECSVSWVDQTEQLGTGHAVREALAVLSSDHPTIVLYGDVPLVSEAVIRRAVESAQAGHVGLVTALMDDPAELGRIVRSETGEVQAIVEYKDADDQVRAIHEINSGIISVPAGQTRCMDCGVSKMTTPNKNTISRTSLRWPCRTR